MVRRTIREANVKLRRIAISPGTVRLRRSLGAQAMESRDVRIGVSSQAAEQ